MKESPTVLENLEECYIKGIGLKITHDDIVDLLNAIKSEVPIDAETEAAFRRELLKAEKQPGVWLNDDEVNLVIDVIKSGYILRKQQ